MFTGIRWRLISRYTAVISVAILTAGISFIYFLNSFYLESMQKDLLIQASLISRLLSEVYTREGSSASLDQLCKDLGRQLGLNITLVAPDGTVIGDSKENPALMKNHLSLPEIQEALRVGKGTVMRKNDDLNEEIFYTAVLIDNDRSAGGMQSSLSGFIRLAAPLSELSTAVSRIQLFTFIALVVSTMAALLVGMVLSVRITGPLKDISAAARSIAAGNFNPSLTVAGNDEMTALARTIREMGRALQIKVQEILLEKNKLDAVISAADSGIVMVDCAFKIELMNPAAEKIFVVSKKEIAGSSVQAALRYYSLFENIQKVCQDGKPCNFEMTLYHPRSITLQASLVPVIGPEGGVKGVLALFHDITAMRSVEQMRSDFVANVSHELRTPLTAIKGYAETILDQDLTREEQADFLNIIDREAGRLARLVDALLDLSTIEGLKSTVKKEAVNLMELCKRSVHDLEEARFNKNMALNTSFPPNPVYVYGNPDWLRQVLVNVLDNSIKYGYCGGTINLAVSQTEEMITVSVSDSGPGIPKADLPYVFERFYRVEKSRTRTSGGTGLGLAIVKHILEAHGSAYSINSMPGHGTIFQFTLPRYR
ncbi:MAG: HAMP domain-containing protein [Dethiobacter sp.]|nr:HAMP domain-containing protein [Dethiobacter sp.]